MALRTDTGKTETSVFNVFCLLTPETSLLIWCLLVWNSLLCKQGPRISFCPGNLKPSISVHVNLPPTKLKMSSAFSSPIHVLHLILYQYVATLNQLWHWRYRNCLCQGGISQNGKLYITNSWYTRWVRGKILKKFEKFIVTMHNSILKAYVFQ